MSELAKWNNFYVIVGSSAGALIGLQFVVLTLIANRPSSGSAEAGAAFGSPTTVHFSLVLFLAALSQAPWETISVIAAVWGILGFGGIAYSVIVARRMRTQVAYTPVFEDWMFHCVLPLFAYALLALSSLVAGIHTRAALFGVGSVSLLLLFVAIHNSWDSIAYHVLVKLAGKDTPSVANEGNPQTK
jgi:hypothetical protein